MTVLFSSGPNRQGNEAIKALSAIQAQLHFQFPRRLVGISRGFSSCEAKQHTRVRRSHTVQHAVEQSLVRVYHGGSGGGIGNGCGGGEEAG